MLPVPVPVPPGRRTVAWPYRMPAGIPLGVPVAVRRVVPVIHSEAARESREFYGLLGFEEVMNHGWITTLAAPDTPAAQVSVMSADATAPVPLDISIEVREG